MKLAKRMQATYVNKATRFASGTIKSASLILRKADDKSKYVGTFTMALFKKKTCNHCQKGGVKKYKKYIIVFASVQLRITRLRKYPIDPKAYLGRCM